MSDEEREIVNHEEDHSGSEGEGEGEDVTRDSVTDSSEEEDDDDNEEEIQKVREGFIVDDEDEEIESTKKRRHKKRKRERERPEQNDALDEDDLELLLENSGVKPRGQGNKLKRLKRKPQKRTKIHKLMCQRNTTVNRGHRQRYQTSLPMMTKRRRNWAKA